MEFYFPETFGEQLAFCCAAFTAAAGFVMMFAPGYAMKLFGLAPRGDSYEYAENGRFHFHVEIAHPFTGLILGYRGWLVPRA